MAKNTPKAPAAPADATTQDAIAPAPAPDTTEASNAAGPEQLPDAPAADQAAPEPTADGAAQPEAQAPEVTDEPQLLDPNTIQPPEDAPVTQDPPPPLPKRIKLVTPYGFYDDADQLRMWQAGYETDKPDEIELFVTRGVEFEILE
jgi:hypothetical protein